VRETSTPFFCAIFTSPICQDRLVVNTGRAEEKDVFCAGYPVEDNQSLGKATTVLCQATLGKKNTFFAQFNAKNDNFTKTGSGQTWETLREKGVFPQAKPLGLIRSVLSLVRKTPLFEPFIYKMHLFTKTGSGQT
jgi:hypothetical protein